MLRPNEQTAQAGKYVPANWESGWLRCLLQPRLRLISPWNRERSSSALVLMESRKPIRWTPREAEFDTG